MESASLVCCLCKFEAKSDLDLEGHIDSLHSDIFKTSEEQVIR